MRDLKNYNYLDLVRCKYYPDCVIGRLYVNDIFECFTLEPLFFFCNKFDLSPKVNSGEYDLTLDVVSPKFRYRYPYRTLCHGKVPRLVDVPNHSGILIHIGNYPKDSNGCILVGEKYFVTHPSKIFNSTRAFIKLYKKISTFKYPIKICVSDLSK